MISHLSKDIVIETKSILNNSELNLTVMTSNLSNSINSEQHETPIKKPKDLPLLQPRTAESEQKVMPTLQYLEAQQLFERFQEIVKIIEEEEIQFNDQSPLSRKLEYEASTLKGKLKFSPKNSSMKKRERICYKTQTQEKFIGIVLFDANQKENQMPKEEAEKKIVNEEAKFTTPNAKERERREVESWATRKKVDRSD